MGPVSCCNAFLSSLHAFTQIVLCLKPSSRLSSHWEFLSVQSLVLNDTKARTMFLRDTLISPYISTGTSQTCNYLIICKSLFNICLLYTIRTMTKDSWWKGPHPQSLRHATVMVLNVYLKIHWQCPPKSWEKKQAQWGSLTLDSNSSNIIMRKKYNR